MNAIAVIIALAGGFVAAAAVPRIKNAAMRPANGELKTLRDMDRRICAIAATIAAHLPHVTR